MSSLRDSAAAKAAQLKAPDQSSEQGEPQAPEPSGASAARAAEPLPDVDVGEPGPDGPEQVPVHVAWSRVMGDVRQISKSERYEEGRTKYDFRGVDKTVNAFGPVLRKHGVLVLPVGVQPTYRDTKSKSGTSMRECTVVVTWQVIGPKGDTLPMLLASAGEAMDASDKGTAKAQSVAQRVLLLTAAQVPTGDADPDAAHVERGEAPLRSAASYRDEALDPGTSRQRMRQIHWELKQQRRLGESVKNEIDEDESIGALIERIGLERFGKDRAGGDQQ